MPPNLTGAVTAYGFNGVSSTADRLIWIRDFCQLRVQSAFSVCHAALMRTPSPRGGLGVVP